MSVDFDIMQCFYEGQESEREKEQMRVGSAVKFGHGF
jgi:hypothetical protein